MRLSVVNVSIEVTTVVFPDADRLIETDGGELEQMAEMFHLLPNTRPPNRSICENGVRPCPYVSCRYNLYLDVRGDGVLRVNFPDREPEEMLASCALDMADDGPRTLDQVAGLMGMSKERARQIEAVAMGKLKQALGAREYDDLDEGF